MLTCHFMEHHNGCTYDAGDVLVTWNQWEAGMNFASSGPAISPLVTEKMQRQLQTYFGLWTDIIIYYALGREYGVMKNRYSRLLFTSEDRLCANLRVQEQSTNMVSQCLYLAFAWRHRSNVVTSQCQFRKDRPWRQLQNERSMIVFRKKNVLRTYNSVQEIK